MQLVVDDVENFAPVVLHSPPMSEEEFVAICEKYEDYQVEYDRDTEAILIMPPTDGGASIRKNDISWQLTSWARRDNRGVVYDSSGGFLLPDGSRRSADAAWVEETRYRAAHAKEPRRFPVLCPDFVIELRSTSDRLRALQLKMTKWVESGAQLAWLVDPQKRTVTVYRPGRDPEVLQNPVEAEGPVAGFVLDLTAIWREI
jgi:Uma2 family endonuclease